MDPQILSREHYEVAQRTRAILQRNQDLQDIIAIMGMEELSPEDRTTVMRARKIQRFMAQPFHVAEHFTNRAGAYVKIEDTVRGFRMICDGELDDVPEQAFYMAGTIDEVLNRVGKKR